MTTFLVLVLLRKTFEIVVLLSIGDIGGADRTFACKSQECLWQDWYICNIIIRHVASDNEQIIRDDDNEEEFDRNTIWKGRMMLVY